MVTAPATTTVQARITVTYLEIATTASFVSYWTTASATAAQRGATRATTLQDHLLQYVKSKQSAVTFEA